MAKVYADLIRKGYKTLEDVGQTESRGTGNFRR